MLMTNHNLVFLKSQNFYKELDAISIHSLPRLYPTNINRSKEKNSFPLKEKKKKAVDTQQKLLQEALGHLLSVDSIDDLMLDTNTPAQTEYLQHRLEQAARGIGLVDT